jgi:uncharacterized membrane protein YjjB (DUF3815 family)
VDHHLRLLYFGPPTGLLPWMLPPTVSLMLPGFWLLVPGSLGFMGVTQLLGTHSTAVFTATLISMMSIAPGVKTGLLLWRAAIQLTSAPGRRAFHD